MYRWIHRVWYADGAFGWMLLPLSACYWLLLRIRGFLYRLNLKTTTRVNAPVIVVGNITAGGTGKTPTVIWLVNELQKRGYRPGIISRGYGGSRSDTPMRVDAHSEAAVVGDEPVLLAVHGQCPVIVDANRARAAQMLIEDGVDVIVADDGLQHLRLQRDFEICVVDGERMFGNGRLIPAGPLRDSVSRLHRVDQILINGAGDLPGALRFTLQPGDATRLDDSLARPLHGFQETTVHAVAGIGNPGRFFDMLRSYGIQVIEHSFPDHAALTKSDLQFADDFNVFMTEKDKVKLGGGFAAKYWYVPVELQFETGDADKLLDRIEMCVRSHSEDR